MADKRLYRSQTDAMIGGVCGGLGNYMNVDPILFRLLFVLALIVGGSGFLVYIILWIVIPEEQVPPIQSEPNTSDDMTDTNTQTETNEKTGKTPERPSRNDGNLWGGLILITLGGIFLIDRFVPRIDFGDLWPLILIVVGIILITKSIQQTKQ